MLDVAASAVTKVTTNVIAQIVKLLADDKRIEISG